MLTITYQTKYSEFVEHCTLITAVTLMVVPTYYRETISLSADRLEGEKVLGHYEYRGSIHHIFGVVSLLFFWAGFDPIFEEMKLQERMVGCLLRDIRRQGAKFGQEGVGD